MLLAAAAEEVVLSALEPVEVDPLLGDLAYHPKTTQPAVQPVPLSIPTDPPTHPDFSEALAAHDLFSAADAEPLDPVPIAPVGTSETSLAPHLQSQFLGQSKGGEITAGASDGHMALPATTKIWTRATVHPFGPRLACAGDQQTVISGSYPIYCLDDLGFSTNNGDQVTPPLAALLCIERQATCKIFPCQFVLSFTVRNSFVVCLGKQLYFVLPLLVFKCCLHGYFPQPMG